MVLDCNPFFRIKYCQSLYKTILVYFIIFYWLCSVELLLINKWCSLVLLLSVLFWLLSKKKKALLPPSTLLFMILPLVLVVVFYCPLFPSFSSLWWQWCVIYSFNIWSKFVVLPTAAVVKLTFAVASFVVVVVVVLSSCCVAFVYCVYHCPLYLSQEMCLWFSKSQFSIVFLIKRMQSWNHDFIKQFCL